MLFLAIKAFVSGVIIAAASEVARRWPGVGGLIVSLPLVSLLTFIWVWHDTRDNLLETIGFGADVQQILELTAHLHRQDYCDQWAAGDDVCKQV